MEDQAALDNYMQSDEHTNMAKRAAPLLDSSDGSPHLAFDITDNSPEATRCGSALRDNLLIA
eukprot:CAMPEP_0182475890 /NCGR_PEP_ID=MMETSP1319-20130603/28128_1 /TAXON_ID=172717 /ORGANISM="Bolidomonas pacifica, Strain RCC208" /LENGTH=61 /DNA_ID=CAMNT_0024676931 /DNA_START=77 /DNA_END=259 /DNA_ORIENTATION=-